MKRINSHFTLFATDLSNHLSCEHLTQLSRQVALKELERPSWIDPSLKILMERGAEHEAAYLSYLRARGYSVVNVNGQGMEAVINAMSKGVDVIAQAEFEFENWAGRADILFKIDGQSKFGNWSYEVQDTKLAQNTKAQTILQLCLYSELLGITLENEPERMAVVKPGENFPTEYYRYSDFKAYYRLIKANLERVLSKSPLPTYPEPTEHCSICIWWKACDKRRHDDDHLSLVAGIRKMHIAELNTQGIETLETFAETIGIRKPQKGNLESYLRKRDQAKVQLEGKRKENLIFRFLPPEQGRGFNRLPEPNLGDVYFDIEGDMFYEEGGLEYLLGFSFQDEAGKLVHQKIWATNHIEEKVAFSAFMKFIMERWKKYPAMHIYHFAPYEPSTIKRLSRAHAMHEQDLDRILRGERFIDLHSVFKEALLASVERYSLKDLEKFAQYERTVALEVASRSRKAVEVALELHEFSSIPSQTISDVEKYNEDDCLATEALHRWLEERRAESVKAGNEITRPELKTGEAKENIQQLDTRSQALFNGLLNGLPDDKSLWTDEHRAKWLMAHQIDYFRREDKSAWWEFFRVHELEHEELLEERKAISGLQYQYDLPLKPRERIPVQRYSFPPQEISLSLGDKLVEVRGEEIGTLQSISVEEGWIEIKKTGKTIKIHPYSVHARDNVETKILAGSLMDLAQVIDEDGLDHKLTDQAAKDLLMRRKPQLMDGTEGAYVMDGENVSESALRIALGLNNSVLAIQGPPGTGKTYTGAQMIIGLAKAGKKIGITATSHKVIRNLIDEVVELSRKENFDVQLVHKVKELSANLPPELTEVEDNPDAIQALQQGKIVGGTAWLWANIDSKGCLDYLFVDEAGQMSLSHVLAASRAAQNLVLLGDPQQLEQPQKGAHPEGSDVAALAYLLEGHDTMPAGKGLFFGVTHRLHPNICKFTSEVFYEGKLHSLSVLESQFIMGGTSFDGCGLFYIPIDHRGNQNKSIEEADAISNIVSELLQQGKWSDSSRVVRPLTNEDILIVAPYNAQVASLMEKLPDMRIGTVDKFQGQQAPVVIYSMTSSSHSDAPRGMNFLYSPNRLNVATSRAKCICILVASPKLLEPDCKTIEQMKWANALCRFKELAKTVSK